MRRHLPPASLLASLLLTVLVVGPATSAARPTPRPADDFDALVRALKRAPDAPSALSWLYRLDGAPGRFEGKRDRLPDAVAAVRRARRAPALLRDHAGLMALRKQTARGEDSAKLRAELGIPADWAVIGPFDNLGNRAFAAADGPEQAGFAGITGGRVHPGRYGDVRWRFLPAAGTRGWVDLASLFDQPGEEEVSAYLATAFRLSAARKVDLRVGSADSVRVWVDGVEVHARDVRRDGFHDQDVVPLRLPAGRHVLVVEVCRQRTPWSLSVRLTAPGGGPLSGLTLLSRNLDLLPIQHDGVAAEPRRAPAPLARLTAQIDGASPDKAPDAALLGAAARLQFLFHPDERGDETARRLYELALQSAPEDARLHLALAGAVKDDDRRRRALQDAVRYAGDDQRTRISALAQLVLRRLARGELHKARVRALELEKAAPDHPVVALYRAERLEGLGESFLALAAVEKALERTPHHAGLLRTAMELSRALRDPVGELRWAQARLAVDATDRVARGRALNLTARTPGASAADAATAALRLDPYNLGLRLQRLRALATEGRVDEALKTVTEDLKLYPESHRLYTAQGDLFLRRGDRAAAVDAFGRSLALRPQQADVRQRRDYHARKATGADKTEQKAAGALVPREPPPACREAGACILRDETVVHVRPNGLTSRTVERLVLVVDRRMRDALKAYPVAFVPGEHRLVILEAQRIRPDGAVSGPTSVRTVAPRGRTAGVYTQTHRRVLTFDDLAAGDAVLVRYRLDDAVVRNPFGSFFGDVRPMQSQLPVVESRYVLDVPATRTLHTFQQGVDAPKVEEADGRRVYSWEAHDLPAIIWEPRMPGYTEIGAYVSVSTFAQWQELNDWYADLTREQREPDDDIRETVEKLVDGVDDPAERVRQIYGWVVANTRYVGIEFGIHGFKPYSVTQVFRRGYGDCKDKSFLLVTMLGLAGVEAHPVLVRTRDRGYFTAEPPTPWAFNHVITYVPAMDLWLDGTAEHSGTRELPGLDQDAMVLVVRDGAAPTLRRAPIPAPDENADDYEAVLVLAPDGSATLRATERMTGTFASHARRLLHEESRRAEHLEKLLGSTFPGARVLEVRVSDTDDREIPVELGLLAQLPGVAARAESSLRMRVTPFPSSLPALASQSDRVHDLILDRTQRERNSVEIQPPAGWRMAETPEPGEVTSPFGHYAIRVEQEGERVRVTSELVLNVIRVPAEQFAEFREFCLAIDRLQRRTLVFQP